MKYKLLIAEQDPLERLGLMRTLSTHLGRHLILLEAETGPQALALFHQEHPHIAILNVGLPEITGLEVGEQIRSLSRSCILLFISDLDNFSYARQAISLRALEFMTKPFDETTLVGVVEEAIGYCSHLQNLSRPAPLPKHTEPSTPSPGFPEGTRLALVQEEISAYIDAHYMEELSMKNVANAMNYSDAYFCKLFKQCFHVNFSTYLNQYRIQKAKAMMEHSRASIKDISIACGYTDSNYFARIFKRLTNLTPSQYRLSLSENR